MSNKSINRTGNSRILKWGNITKKETNMRKSFFVFGLAYVCLIVLPISAYADKCDDMKNKASSTFEEASSANAQGDSARAIELYEEAAGYYQKASQMRNCNCPLINKSATTNVEICKHNIDNIRKQMEGNAEVDTFNQGVAKFNEGNSYARNGEWELAVNSFDEAEKIWNGIDPSSGEAGKNAQQMAKTANELSQKARLQM
jgi:tetratricopeptide (TPR) repeat protein